MKYNYSSRLVADSEYTKIIMTGLLVKNVIILIRLVKISTFKSFHAKRLNRVHLILLNL